MGPFFFLLLLFLMHKGTVLLSTRTLSKKCGMSYLDAFDASIILASCQGCAETGFWESSACSSFAKPRNYSLKMFEFVRSWSSHGLIVILKYAALLFFFFYLLSFLFPFWHKGWVICDHFFVVFVYLFFLLIFPVRLSYSCGGEKKRGKVSKGEKRKKKKTQPQA